MSRLRVALLGCGRIARRVHLPVLGSLSRAHLVALADADPEQRAQAERAAPRATSHADYRRLLEAEELDAAVLCLPTPLHAEAAEACFRRGLHVYVEKPLATSLEDADRVLRAAAQAARQGRVGFNFRFHPLVRELAVAIRERRLGEITAVQTVFAAARRDLPDWKLQRADGGGALLDLASHHVDLLHHLFETETAEVTALIRSVVSEDDTAVVGLRLANGVLASVTVSTAAAEDDRITVYGESGALTLDRYRSRRLEALPARRSFRALDRLGAAARRIARSPSRLADSLRPPTEDSFRRSLSSFVEAARRNGADPSEPAADLEDGRRSLATVLAAEEAARSGRPVPT